MVLFSKIQRNSEVIKFSGDVNIENFEIIPSIPFYAILDYHGNLVFFEVGKDRKLSKEIINEILVECLTFMEVN